jgi:hypothetical protein
MHQAKRERNDRGEVVASIADYEMVWRLTKDRIEEAQDRKLPQAVHRAFNVIYERMKAEREKWTAGNNTAPAPNIAGADMLTGSTFSIYDPRTGQQETYPMIAYSRKQLGPAMGVSDRTAGKHLALLYEHELLANVAQPYAKPVLQLIGFPELLPASSDGLPHPDLVRREFQA